MKHEVALEIFLREECLSSPAALSPGVSTQHLDGQQKAIDGEEIVLL